MNYSHRREVDVAQKQGVLYSTENRCNSDPFLCKVALLAKHIAKEGDRFSSSSQNAIAGTAITAGDGGVASEAVKVTILGSHNFLISDTKSTEREVGLRTNDPRIITDLIKRFDTAKDLEKQ